MRILLVEDDELLGDSLRTGLKHYGLVVDWMKDGEEATNAFISKHEKFDVIVLDLGLPKMSGLKFLYNLRHTYEINTPVIILTARETIQDRVKGLDAGADDYLTKPFDLSELCARIRALYRRSKSRTRPTISHGNIILDPAAYTVTHKGKQLLLPRKEFALLQTLLEHPGRVIAREQLNQTLYGWEDSIDSNALEVHIHNLRRHFGNSLIKTVRGVGYMIEQTNSSSDKNK
jgi:two-component system response regulator QseB